MPRCKLCKSKFEAKIFLQKHCMENDECIRAEIDYKKEQKRKADQKAWNKRKKEGLEELKTKPEHLNDLQIIINAIAREIDKRSTCMMCRCVMKKSNGCHYHSVGSKPSLRFNLLNIWIGCESCNNYKGGNINGYDEVLIDSYGKDKWEVIKFDLPRNNARLSLSIPEIQELKPKCRAILKDLKAGPQLTLSERWDKRLELNNKLGMYE